MKCSYKITKANEWKNFNSILIVLIGIIIAAPIVFYYRSPDGNFWDYLLFLFIGFLLFLIPLIIIHMRYYTLNEGMEMLYDENAGSIIIKSRKEDYVCSFHLDDIEYVVHTMTPAMAEKRMEWFPWDSYNYSRIYLKSGEKFTITSLMVYRLELPVGKRYLVSKTLYPYP